MKVHCVIQNYFKVWKIIRPIPTGSKRRGATTNNQKWVKLNQDSAEHPQRNTGVYGWSLRGDAGNAGGVAGSLPLQKVIIRALMVFVESCVFFSCLDMPPSQRQTSSGLKRHGLWVTKADTLWKRATHYQKPLQSQKIMRRWGHTILLTSWGWEESSWVKSFLTRVY